MIQQGVGTFVSFMLLYALLIYLRDDFIGSKFQDQVHCRVWYGAGYPAPYDQREAVENTRHTIQLESLKYEGESEGKLPGIVFSFSYFLPSHLNMWIDASEGELERHQG